MHTTQIAVYDTPAQAHRAVEALMASGYSQDDISMATPGAQETESEVPSLVVKDAEKGALVGGLAGLLLGLSELTVPGVGPILAVGWLATTLITVLGAGIGAATGTIAGALIEKGISADVAHSVAEAIHQGKTVVTVRVSHDRARAAEDLLGEFGPQHVHR